MAQHLCDVDRYKTAGIVFPYQIKNMAKYVRAMPSQKLIQKLMLPFVIAASVKGWLMTLQYMATVYIGMNA